MAAKCIYCGSRNTTPKNDKRVQCKDCGRITVQPPRR